MATRRTTRQHQPTVPRAGLYIRVSDPKQERDGTSLATQEAAARAYCAERGYEIVEVYSDVHTGQDAFQRPGLSALRAAIRARAVDVVVAHALDRLSRDQNHRGLLFSEADYAGVAIEFVTEKLEDTPEGRLILAVRSFTAEVERLKITERTQRGIRARVEQGKLPPKARPLYGYWWRDDAKTAYDIDDETAAVVRRVFAEVAAGRTIRAVAKGLTAEGIATPRRNGLPWASSTLCGILKNREYTGEAVAFKRQHTRTKSGTYDVSERPEAEWVRLPDGTVPTLIDVATFEIVQRRLALNKERASRNNRAPALTLLRGGIARCGYCGGPAIVNRVGRTPLPTYRCVGTRADRYDCPGFGVVAHLVDRIVLAKVEELLNHPEVYTAKARQASQKDRGDDLIAELDKRSRAVAERRQRLARAVAALDDDAAASPLLDELRSLAAEAKRLQAERTEAETRRANSASADARMIDFETWCRRIAANLHELDYDQKRRLLDDLGTTVRLWKAKHRPRWEITMQPNPSDPESAIVFSGAPADGEGGPAPVHRTAASRPAMEGGARPGVRRGRIRRRI
jgi:site-specific DNA recombinase